MNLYENDGGEAGLGNVINKFRLDSVLIRGTRNMSSNDVFKYLKFHNQFPIKMEWINDAQCKFKIPFGLEMR